MTVYTGTTGNDVLAGGTGDDLLYGLEGNDRLYGGTSGSDVLEGGEGDDYLDGGDGSGRDTASYASATAGVVVSLAIAGVQDTFGAGRDTLFAIENLLGSAFADRLFGDGGDNVIDGAGGVDTVSYVAAAGGITADLGLTTAQNTGGAGIDTLLNLENLTGSAFDDVLSGNSGNNIIGGGVGIDRLSYAGATAGVVVSLAQTTQQDTVGAGRDTVFGFENLTGSAFNDKLAGDDGDNLLDGGAGVDTLSYSAAAGGVTVRLALATAQATGGDGTDTVVNFENLTGSAFDDVLGGTAGNNILAGGAGNDTVTYADATAGVTVSLALAGGQNTVGAGTDTLQSIENLVGSAFADRLFGSDGDNVLDGGAGIDLVSYASAGAGVRVSLATTGAQNTLGGGNDRLSNFENLTGSGFDDVLAGNAGDNVISGGAGVDTVTYADAAAGVTVSLDLATLQDTIGAGRDTLFNIENLTGSAFNDRLFGNEGDNVLDGGAGVDLISYANAAAGVRVSLAATGIQITGGAGSDTLAGFENLTGSGFDDILAGNAGNNVLSAGAGNDTASYADAAAGVIVNLGLGTAQDTGGAGTDTLFAFENLTGSAFDDRLFGTDGDNVLAGGAGIDTVSYAFAAAGVIVDLARTTAQATGGAGTDTLSGFENVAGSAFDDRLTGTAGDNVFSGGGGSDTVSYANATAGVTVSLSSGAPQATVGAGSDTLFSIENLVGSSFNDRLFGNAADNVFDGGNGIDSVSYLDATSGVTVSLGITGAQDTRGAGTDTLLNIETLVGSTFDDVLAGNAGNNILNAGAGNDTVTYAAATAGVVVSLALTYAQNTIGAGRDTLQAFENVIGTDFRDKLFGNDFDNLLTGGLGDDQLSGALGNDTAVYGGSTAGVVVDLRIAGAQNTIGAGNDTLIEIENLSGSDFGDTLIGDDRANVLTGGLGNDILTGNGGIDTASYAGIFGGVDIDLTLIGAQAAGAAGADLLSGIENLIGTDFADRLAGDAGANIIEGGGGNDVLLAGAGIDTASYASATTGVTVSLALTGAQDTLGAGVDTLSGFENLAGSAFNDTLIGDAGNNILSGGRGNDTLIGGAGIDTVSYADAASAVTVNLLILRPQGTRGGNYDTISEVENITGSRFKDVLTGNAGNNVLNGGAGADRLTGGKGADLFVLDVLGLAADKDTIVDFKVIDDTIALGHGAFSALAVGALDPSAFITGTAATTADQHVIYNGTSGALFYDADGNGAGAQIQIAQLTGLPVLTAADFVVIG